MQFLELIEFLRVEREMSKRRIDLERSEIAAEMGEVAVLKKIAHALLDIRDILRLTADRGLPVKGVISQGESMVSGSIKGLNPGASDTFFATPVDVNGNASALPAGSPAPSFSADDSTVTVTTSPDGLSASVTAASTATVGSSFNLNWSATFTNSAGASVTITGTAPIPILGAATTEPVGAVLSQGSPAV